MQLVDAYKRSPDISKVRIDLLLGYLRTFVTQKRHLCLVVWVTESLVTLQQLQSSFILFLLSIYVSSVLIFVDCVSYA